MEDFEYKENHAEICSRIQKEYSELNEFLVDISSILIFDNESGIELKSEERIALAKDAVKEDVLSFEKLHFFFKDKYLLMYYFARYLIIKEYNGNIYDLLDFLYKDDYRKIDYDIAEKVKAIVLIIINNEGNQNISKRLIDLEGKVEEKFWSIIFSYSNALPYLNVNPLDLISVLKVYQENSKNSYNSSDIEGSLTKYTISHTQEGEIIYKELIKHPDAETVFFVPFILKGFFKSKGIALVYKEAISLVNEKNINLSKVGITSLCLFEYIDSEDQKYIRATIDVCEGLISKENCDLIPIIINNIRHLAKYSNSILKWILSVSKIQNANIQLSVASALRSYHDKHLEEKWYIDALKNLCIVENKYKGIIQEIDSCLRFISIKNPEFALEFFELWIKNHEFEKNRERVIYKNFRWTITSLTQKHFDILEKYITKWLNEDDEKFPYVSSYMLVEIYSHNSCEFKLSKEVLNTLLFKDIKYVLFKILGYVYRYEILCPIVYSILLKENISNDMIALVESAFTSFITYNYPGYSRRFLENKIENGNEIEKVTAGKILSFLNDYQHKLKTLPHLREFETSNIRKDKYLAQKHKKQSEEFENYKSDETSLLNFIKKTVLKGGKASFTKFDGSFTEKAFLHEMRTSFEVPLGELKDPVGQAFQLFNWKIYKREKF